MPREEACTKQKQEEAIRQQGMVGSRHQPQSHGPLQNASSAGREITCDRAFAKARRAGGGSTAADPAATITKASPFVKKEVCGPHDEEAEDELRGIIDGTWAKEDDDSSDGSNSEASTMEDRLC
jgi:hypothetical protein